MSTVQTVWGTVWRSVVVGIGYILALIVTGVISSALGVQMPDTQGSESLLVWLFVSGILIGLFLGPLASQMPASRLRHIAVWSSVIFFNLGSVMIEGMIFAPELVSLPMPVLIVQQLLAALVVAFLITMLFSPSGKVVSLVEVLCRRPWYAWAWRFVVSTFSYLLFYWVFGAVNYTLVTKPYYDSHTGGLTVPPLEVVLTAELVRAPLIVLSVLLFLLSIRTTRRRLIVMTGLMLFGIGGVVPLLMQVNTFPPLLLVASSIEIFFQNFLTGLVAAVLLGTVQSNAVSENNGE